MNTKRHKVVVIFDPNFGHKLNEVAKHAHTWAIQSPSNEEAAEKYLQGLGNRNASEEEMQVGLTLFEPRTIDVDFLETLDEHQGEYAPWNELEVIGQKLDASIQQALSDADFVVVQSYDTGFIARRGPTPTK